MICKHNYEACIFCYKLFTKIIPKKEIDTLMSGVGVCCTGDQPASVDVLLPSAVLRGEYHSAAVWVLGLPRKLNQNIYTLKNMNI